VPATPPAFTLRVEAQGSLLYDRRTHTYTRLAAAEAFLLVSAREVGLEEATSRLGTAVGEEAAREARAALERQGALAGGGFRGRVVELEKGLAGAWASPLVGHLGLTQACNFACAFCYARAGRRARDELTLAQWTDVVDQLAVLGCQRLVLGGGEPLLRRDVPALVRHADGLGVDCFVNTNGSRIRRALLEEWESCPPAGVAVSLDGPDAETNDALRGPGTFRLATRGIRLLRRHHRPGFAISVTVTPRNAALVARMVELASAQGASTLLLRPAYPAGVALDSAGLACDREMFARAVETARPRAHQLGVLLDAPHPEERGVPDFTGFGCVAGRLVVGVTPRGAVTPCLNLPPAWEAGDVRSTPLLTTWREGAPFRALREAKPLQGCARCAKYETCRGGCRARALAAGHGVRGADSWCHRPVVAARSLKSPGRAGPPRSGDG
jgi:radical SAM protein with 4Fe4S-binding SPASM domain